MRKENGKKKRRVFLWVLLILVLLSLSALLLLVVKLKLGGGKYLADKDVRVDTTVLETETEEKPTASQLYHLEEVHPVSEEEAANTWTLLVIGTDREEKAVRENETSRAKATAIILMTINHNVQEVFFHSMHTDLYAVLPDLQEEEDETGAQETEGNAGTEYWEPNTGCRLADAYRIGGGPLLEKTIEKNYGILIDQYATISLRDVAEVLQMPEFATMDISNEGVDVIENLVYSMADIGPAKMAGYLSKMLPFVTHNMEDQEVVRMLLQVPRVVAYVSEKEKLPYEGLYEEAEGYLVPQIGETTKRLQTMLYA